MRAGRRRPRPQAWAGVGSAWLELGPVLLPASCVKFGGNITPCLSSAPGAID
eukprot:CAMPEP_0117667082 /NCGR_PEP_ID=MMETSP0804-20121206/10755_1 /TAXON_ID=1074897 /ORGANISM="Tetraselmis astigmatica, Strain CCMP880" /LENGTH=51 /DNA_ID=CAMNT_0005474741 /DNA_START=296 /DNA_END=454 /DNA_ORIENTATION=-